MGCLTSLLLLLSIGIFIVFDVFFWSVSWIFGLIGILAIVAFVIAYAVSEEFSLSPRDYIRNSDWGIFCKKIGWAWGIALMVYAAATVIVLFAAEW